MLRIGHRGAAGHAAENTLSAIENGIALGVDFVEIDIQRTRDSELIVMHDKRVDRTTNGKGYVSQMSFEELRKLDAGNGESIPTVAEVLDCARGRVGVILEIISCDIAEQLFATVQKSGFKEPVIYASFLHAELLHVRHIKSSAATMGLLEGVPVRETDFAKDAKVTHVGVAIESITADFVQSLRRSRRKVFVYTVNDPRDIKWLQSLKVDGIISDFPERIALKK